MVIRFASACSLLLAVCSIILIHWQKITGVSQGHIIKLNFFIHKGRFNFALGGSTHPSGITLLIYSNIQFVSWC